MVLSVIKRYIYIVSNEGAVLILGFVITPILTRLLGAGSYGDYAFIMSIIAIIMIPISAGVFDGLRKFFSESMGSKDSDHIFVFYIYLTIGLGVLGSGVVLLSVKIGIVEFLLQTKFESYFLIAAAIIFSRQLLTFTRGLLMGFGQERYSEPLKTLQKILFGIISTVLIYKGFGVNGALTGYLISTIIIVIISVYLIREFVPEKSKLFSIPPQNIIKRSIKFNTLSTAFVFLTATLYHVDILLLRPTVGGVETGYYKAALTIAELLWFVPTTLQTILLQATSKMWSEERVAAINTLASRITRYTLLLTIIMAIGIASMAQTFLPLYFGKEFSAAVWPLLLLLPGSIGFAVARPLFAIGQGKGEMRLLVLSTAVASGINLILNLILIPKYGIYGAAIATSVSYATMSIVHMWSARQIGLTPTSDLRLSRIILTSAVSAPPIYFLSQYLPNKLSIVTIPVVGLILYGSLAILFGAVDISEFRYITEEI